MPTVKVHPPSGGILFHQTPEERKVNAMKKELKKELSEIKELKRELKKIIDQRK